MTTRIAFYTDCSYFAGCENMLATLLGAPQLLSEYEVSFAYRFSAAYRDGLERRLALRIPVETVRLPEVHDFSLLPRRWSVLARRVVFLAQRVVLTVPLFVLEVWTFFRMMRARRPGILHVNNGGYPGALSARAAVIGARLAGVPAILMVVNNMAVGHRTPSRWIGYLVDRLVARSVDVFVTGSEAAAERLTKVLRLPRGRAMAINHGIAFVPATVPSEEVRKSSGVRADSDVLFGVVGVLGPRKGHRVLFEALAELMRHREVTAPKVRVVVVGDGPMRDELRDLADALGVADRVTFVGQQEHVADYMAAIDVLVLPSVEHEDFPFVVLEAMSHGKPVIASRVAGTVEQVEGDLSGFLVASGNVMELAAAMQTLASRADLRAGQGREGRRRFTTYFTAEIAVERYQGLYRAMISAGS